VCQEWALSRTPEVLTRIAPQSDDLFRQVWRSAKTGVSGVGSGNRGAAAEDEKRNHPN